MHASSRDPRAFALTGEDDSTEPESFAGDCVVLEPSSAPRNDEVPLRVCRKLPSGKIRLSSCRPEIYLTIEHDPAGFHWIFPVVALYRKV